MRKVWILVANSSDAKLYKAESIKQLTEIRDFKHIESKMPAHELVSDRPGRATSKNKAGVHMFADKTSQKVKEKNYFAEEIMTYLVGELNKGNFERLYVIAPANFLGALRSAADPHVSQLIHAEIDKDIPMATSNEILQYLPPVL